ncbi:hypothetical protein [Lysobacter enzymogenes]|uniref:hypothetical protein n=1 Tax=Lysobacter enzymogenes TaxID=69 RepID=UPI001AF03FE3|nr:hypothetical protein [Lysobacter enzymogenes]QQP99134.1 hypothetical protein JHW41_13415 [Lysobacter enzymogenes]
MRYKKHAASVFRDAVTVLVHASGVPVGLLYRAVFVSAAFSGLLLADASGTTQLQAGLPPTQRRRGCVLAA